MAKVEPPAQIWLAHSNVDGLYYPRLSEAEARHDCERVRSQGLAAGEQVDVATYVSTDAENPRCGIYPPVEAPPFTLTEE